MKPIDLVIRKKGFCYTQVLREEDCAVYAQSYDGETPFAYEIIVIQSHNGREMFGTHIPATEYYPSTDTWGVKGWTVSGYPDNKAVAIARMHSLVKERAEKKAAKDAKIASEIA